ncbi:DUF305 domain-containing protein [Candidatus Nanohalococcus occultus]|uniref:DUF305 domain-containing protein n=1 Tax=Candidatus Nanohalococcus occultus TaxID=2978047 RepID=UPI0039DF2D40
MSGWMKKFTDKLRTDRKTSVALLTVLMVALAAAGVFQLSGGSDQRPEFNRNDIMFMNMMIIHHDQAVEMAELSENRTNNSNILEISQNISEAQQEENRVMAEWLRGAGFNRPTRGHRMAGMATAQEMEQLRQSRGREYDLLFSKLMIEHHRGGIQMARAEVQNGRSEKLIDLAQEMVEAQTEEIQRMESWRDEWTGSS